MADMDQKVAAINGTDMGTYYAGSVRKVTDIGVFG